MYRKIFDLAQTVRGALLTSLLRLVPAILEVIYIYVCDLSIYLSIYIHIKIYPAIYVYIYILIYHQQLEALCRPLLLRLVPAILEVNTIEW